MQASTFTLAHWPGAFFGLSGPPVPVRVTSFHILLAPWATVVSDRFHRISHSHKSSFYYTGETGASCIQKQVVTESFYENIVHVYSHHRQ